MGQGARPAAPAVAPQPPTATSSRRSGDPPHLLPYQGSKRRLAAQVLAVTDGRRFRRMYEPCCGSAAVSLRAAHEGLADQYILGDSLESLIALWRLTLDAPEALAEAYALRWQGQHTDPRGHFEAVRAAFNRDRAPADLLYLLARCVKGALRFNRDGDFNQAADHRRRGARPDTLRRRLTAVAGLLAGRTLLRAGDLARTLDDAGPDDLVYLDPPYLGTSLGRNKRYHQGLAAERLLQVLADLDRRGVPLLLSYDGRTGTHTYGAPLPDDLGLVRFAVAAGISSQGTLSGRRVETIESLYVSAELAPAAARVLPRWHELDD